MVDVINRALVPETAPKLAQVVPSVEYCHVPLPVTPVMAKPLRALVSTSAQLTPLKMAEAKVPLEVVSSVVAAKVGVAPLVMVGASLTAVTLIEAVALLFENAVLPPELAVVA